MTRLIDADAFEEEARSRIDMQDLYLPIHIKDFVIDEMPTVDAVPVVMIESRINGLKKMLIDIDSDDVDNIWALRTEIDTLTELLEMWAERKDV